MIRVACIGLGYWGPNLLRVLVQLPGVEVAVVCDRERSRAASVAQQLTRGTAVVDDVQAVWSNSQVDAVVIATPTPTHFELVRAALAAGKHVFVEKPLATAVAECDELIALAAAQQRVLMVGHVFEYNAAVLKVKEYLRLGSLGVPLYIYSRRTNLGRIQGDLNALWSFAPHDVSIINYWLEAEPFAVSARGFSYLHPERADVVFVTLAYPNNVRAHLHLSWLDPRKVREMTVVGSKQMLVYDDVSADAKLQIYDKGVVRVGEQSLEGSSDFGEFQLRVRTGDVVVPFLEFPEPLKEECRHFLACVERAETPRSDGLSGRRVVRVLEACQQSLQEDGRTVSLGELPPRLRRRKAMVRV